MPVTLGSNIASLRTQRGLSASTKELSSTYERLSSGQRINRASDDAAGLAIAESLNKDRRVLTQGIRNFNDGVSLLNVADGAVEQLSSIVIRLKELAEQAATGTYGVKQRKAIDAEAQALSNEYIRIARSTSFNERGLFLGNFGELRLQGGYGIQGGIQSGLGGAIGTGVLGSRIDYNFTGTGVIGDLNGDGNQDIASVNSAAVNLRFGNGDGTFGSVLTVTVNPSESVALGDLNNDGILDIIAGGTSATVRLGMGNGTFGASVSYSNLLNDAPAMALGDLNADGNLDLVSYGDQSGGYASVMLGNGRGGFGAATTYLNEPSPSSIQLGDLNGDSILDLVTAGYYSSTPTISVRIGRGDGTFGAKTTFTTGTTVGNNYTVNIRLADLNSDGKLDLIAENFIDETAVKLGNGNGTFGSTTLYSDVGDGYGLDVGDLNGDGNVDLAVQKSSGDLFVRLGQGNGTFASSVQYAATSSGNANIADFNNDGVLDVHAGVSIRLGLTTPGISPLLAFKLTSRADSLRALNEFDQALQRLSTQRGIIGAYQSRLNVGANVLRSTADNYSVAASRIKDTDIAEEAARLSRTKILQQASASVLAQANQQPSLALKLLQGK